MLESFSAIALSVSSKTKMAAADPRVSPSDLFQSYVLKNIDELIKILSENASNQERLDYAAFRMEHFISIVLQGNFMGYVDHSVTDLLVSVWNYLEKYLEADHDVHNIPRSNLGCVGRPPYIIQKGWLKQCLDSGFSLKDIANMLGVSDKTISRRVEEFHLRSECPRFTDISDEELYLIVKDIISHPRSQLLTFTHGLGGKEGPGLGRHVVNKMHGKTVHFIFC